MKRSAFTLTELIVVIAILAVLAALLAPVFAGAKQAALESSTGQREHQISLALMIYRTDYGGDGVVGTGSEMGLPRLEQLSAIEDRIPKKLWDTPCIPYSPSGTKPWNMPPRQYTYWPNEDLTLENSWKGMVSVYDEKVPLIDTPNCTKAPNFVFNQFHLKLGIAVTLAGNIKRKINVGSTDYIKFYEQ